MKDKFRANNLAKSGYKHLFTMNGVGAWEGTNVVKSVISKNLSCPLHRRTKPQHRASRSSVDILR